MQKKKIGVRGSFIEELKNGVPKISKNGTIYQKISDELSDFAYKELQDVDASLYQYISGKFIYNRNGMYIGWRGGGPRTIERFFKEEKCSLDLFNVIGAYLYQLDWTLAKQASFKEGMNLAAPQKKKTSQLDSNSKESLRALPKSTEEKNNEYNIKVKGDNNNNIINGRNISIGSSRC